MGGKNKKIYICFSHKRNPEINASNSNKLISKDSTGHLAPGPVRTTPRSSRVGGISLIRGVHKTIARALTGIVLNG